MIPVHLKVNLNLSITSTHSAGISATSSLTVVRQQMWILMFLELNVLMLSRNSGGKNKYLTIAHVLHPSLMKTQEVF